jgi:hypothetical protein
MAIQMVKTPFTKMTFSPDVPSSALAANEYNAGYNVETDVRSIKSVLGEQYILSQIPGNVIFITSGFGYNGVFWFVAATAQGQWYGLNASGITNITPSYGSFLGYNAGTVITASWNGQVVFLNDEINPPMYYWPGQSGFSQIRLYGYPPDNYVWNYDVGYNGSGNVVPLYSSLTCAFVRVYSSPNVGSLLVAGNFLGNVNANVVPGGGTVQSYPTQLRWSQNFGLNAGPTTWAPTLTNVANQLEINVRGQLIDGFTLNGNFYIFSYWDCVLMAPISYTSSNAPVFAFTNVTTGRGLINENCWAVVDSTAYGVDARDIWQFNGQSFTPIGDQRIKNYFYSNLNANYTNQIFMIHNSKKYQIEIYYPDLTSTGYCNQMISYRYDLDAWNPPRAVNKATAAAESPVWTANVANLASRGIVYSSAAGNVQLVQKDIGTAFVGNAAISSLFQRDNITFGQDYSASILTHRVYPEVYGSGNVTIAVGGADAVGNAAVFNTSVNVAIQTNNPWAQITQNEERITSVQLSGNSAVNTWQCSALNWQITKVQDTR